MPSDDVVALPLSITVVVGLPLCQVDGRLQDAELVRFRERT